MGTVLGIDSISFWIVVTGMLVNVSGALLGNYLVLRKMSLMGDAISHAVLPGLAISFVVVQSRSPWAMLIGALIAGLLTVLFTELIRNYAKVPEDSAMGVVFTSLFALGVVVIAKVASQVDLDPGCVLYGILESAALDTVMLGPLEIPRIALTMGIMTAAIIAFVLIFWKELKIVSFDPGLATTLGIHAGLVHYLLMAMVAAFTVAAFEAVGSILVVAMLIVPSATAYLLTDRLHWMAVIASAVGIGSAYFGRMAAWHYETSVAGMMAVVAGIFFALAVVFAPKYGYLVKLVFQARMSLRIVREDAMAMLFRWQELSNQAMPRSDAIKALGGGWSVRIALRQLFGRGFVSADAVGLSLTEPGRADAVTIIRGHRLWETYLAKNLKLPADHLHEPAHRMEHFLDDELVSEVAKEVGEPSHDPHGRTILPDD
jgi:manganese/zinc/iron transport system permease protein